MLVHLHLVIQLSRLVQTMSMQHQMNTTAKSCRYYLRCIKRIRINIYQMMNAKLHWLPIIIQRTDYKTLMYMYIYLNGLAPIYLGSLTEEAFGIFWSKSVSETQSMVVAYLTRRLPGHGMKYR